MAKYRVVYAGSNEPKVFGAGDVDLRGEGPGKLVVLLDEHHRRPVFAVPLEKLSSIEKVAE